MRRLGSLCAIAFAILSQSALGQTVTPKGGTVYVPLGSTNTETFNISNFSGATHFMELSVTCSFAACDVSNASMYVDPGTSFVTVTYSGVTGPGTIYLTVADDNQGTSDVGYRTVAISNSTPLVESTDNTVYSSENASTNYAHFHLYNVGSDASAYTLSAGCSGNASSCSVSSPTSTITPSASIDVVVYFHTGGFASGNASVTLTATSQYGETASKTITVVPLSDAVTVAANGSGTLVPGASANASFTVTDVGNSSPVTYTTSFSCSGVVTTCPSGSSIAVYTGSPQTVYPGYGVSSSLAGGAGAITMTAAISDGFNNYSSSATYSVSVPDSRTYTASVTPASAEYAAEQSTATSYGFTVSNAGNTSATFSLTASTCSGGETGCAPRASSVTLAAGASATEYVDFNVGAAGSAGYVALTAAGPSNSSTGQIHVTPTTGAVGLSPSSTTASVATSGTGSLTFSATNNGNIGSVTYNIGVTCSGSVVSCSAPGGSTVAIAQGSSANVTVSYTASATTGSGGISLHVYKTLAHTYEAYATATIAVTTAPTYGLTVTPDAQAVSYGQSTSQSASFIATNSGNVSNTLTATPSCSGTVSSCSITSTNPVTIAAGSNATITMSYNVGSTGTGTAGISVTGNSVSDGGSYAVTALPPAPAVSLDSANGGEVIARDQCVTLSLGAGAASECGDLRLIHSLPSVRTLDKERAPTLVYNSAHAAPTPIITADVTIPSGTSPDSIRATVTINSTQYASRTWSAATWGAAGVARRVGLSFDGTALSTGSYGYTLTLTSYTAGTAATTNATGNVIIVNRATSPFGAGWWMAGYERLYTLADTTARLWVGGDGSARVYHKSHDSVYVAPALDRPDSLTWNSGISRYVRWDEHRLQVRFDATGAHRETINRLGHTTIFAVGTVLDSIGVPTATSNKQWYHFNYTSAKLSSVSAPGVRTITVTQSSSKITSITGPDTTAVSFGYLSGTNKVSSRANRLGNVTYYAYDAANKVDTLRLDMDGSSIVTRLRAAESQPALSSTPLAVDSVYTVINGPRIDTTVTRIWINRWGAPKRIRDALGHATVLVRGNSTFPALVTADTAPNGFVSQATYDGHGNIATATSIGAYGGTTARTTHYYWNLTWDEPDSVTTPRGIVTRFGYNSSNGNRTYQQTGSSSRRVSFGYNSLNLIDSVTTPASATPMRIAYDGVLANAIQTISPLGVKDTVLTDAIGRDTLSYIVDDSLNKRTRTQFDVMSRPTTVTISGDGGHRPTWISGVGTELPADTVRIATEYDAEGRVKDVTRTRGPSLGYTDSYYQYDAAGRVKIAFEAVKTTHYTYDPAGNVISKNDGEHVVTMKYDALNRIVNKFVPLVTYSSTSCMTSPLMTANFTGYCFFSLPDRVTLGNAYGAAVCFSSDTATYSYDVAGNLVQADNGDARVRRGYYPNGQIQWDTLRTRQTYRGTADECGGTEPAPPPVDSLGICGDEAHGWRPCNITMSKYALPKDHELALGAAPQQRTWASWLQAHISAVDSVIHGPYVGDEESGDGGDIGSLFDGRSLSRAFASSTAPDSEYSHIYGLNYTYNDDGQRSTLLHPTGYNVPSLCYTGPCTESYTYSTSTGELTGITDIHGLSYTIDYDNAGRAYKLTSPGSVTGPVTDTKHYDDDGNVTSVVVVSDIGLLSDSMTYDNMGRVRTGHFAGGVSTNPTEDVTMMYHGLGSVIGMETNASGSVATEAFTVDALGNRLNSWRLPMSYNAADPNTARVMDVSPNGELMTVTSPKNDSTYATYPYFYRKELGYDGVGNLSTVFTKEQNAFGTGGEITMNYPVNYPGYPVNSQTAPGSMSSASLFDMNTMNAMTGPSSYAPAFFTDSISQTAEAHFYDGDNKLRLFNRHNGIDVNSISGSNWLYEEYRYDALGRRIWRRTQGGQAGAYVSRTVWDGDQYLYETISNSNTMPGLESDSAMVGYVNADGLDAPVGVWRGTSSGTVGTMTPHVDWRGAYALGTWDDGSSNPCTGSAPKCSYIAWPAVGMSAARGHPLDVTLPSGYWMGSLLSDATDGSGLQYKRNRYYDPASGRFTQVDPIGLAGGLNAYGFGGGDQVNYSDPFRLYGCRSDDTWCLIAKAGWEALGGTLGTVGGGAAGFVGSLACLEVCAPVAVPAAAVAGGVAGVHTAGRLFDNVLESRAGGSGRGSAQPQRRKLSPGEIKKLKDSGLDPEDR